MFKMSRITDEGNVTVIKLWSEPLDWIQMWFFVKRLAFKLTGNMMNARLLADGEVVVYDAAMEEYLKRSMHSFTDKEGQ